MKKIIQLLPAVIALFLLSFLQGCIKDNCKHTNTYSWFEPVYKTAEAVRANIKSSPAQAIKAPGKLFVIGNYIFLNELNRGIHVIDNSNPALPVNKAFIEIPGNVDIAVKGNILYADLYMDLVALDISNPLNVVRAKIIDNVFPDRYYNGFVQTPGNIITDWIRHDTTVTEDCSANNTGVSPWGTRWGIGVVFQASDAAGPSSSFAGGAPTGISGSMARFTLINNYLYTVGYTDLKAIDITAPQHPVLSNTLNIGWGIETIYPFKDRLFIGSNSGMFIYSVANAAVPVQLGTFSHARVCDPVIADDNYAYVTLRDGTNCAGYLNELDIVDVSNLNTPVFIKKYDLTNPHGLSKDGDLLFICDGRDGFKVFTAADVNDIQIKKHFPGLDTYDVIAYNGLAIVVAKDGLYQFDYSNTDNIHQLSKIGITQ